MKEDFSLILILTVFKIFRIIAFLNRESNPTNCKKNTRNFTIAIKDSNRKGFFFQITKSTMTMMTCDEEDYSFIKKNG